MFIININNIDKFKKNKIGYYFPIVNGISLSFDDTLQYKGLDTCYNISCKNYNKIENEYLSKLYRLGWILFEK